MARNGGPVQPLQGLPLPGPWPRTLFQSRPGHLSQPQQRRSRDNLQLSTASPQGCLIRGAGAVPGTPWPALLPGWASGTDPACKARPWLRGPALPPWGTPSRSQSLGTPGPATPWVIWISGLKGRQDLVLRFPFTLSKVCDVLGMHKGPTMYIYISAVCNWTAGSATGRRWICSKMHQNRRK